MRTPELWELRKSHRVAVTGLQLLRLAEMFVKVCLKVGVNRRYTVIASCKYCSVRYNK